MDMKRNQAGQTPITRIQRPEFGAYMDLLICISMRLESFRNSCILVISGIQRSGPSLKQNIWETQWDKVFSFALIQTWQNSMNSSLSSESLIKSTEHALNVTQGKKTNTKQNKIYVLALSKEINTESFQFFFFSNWLLGTKLWLRIEILASIVCTKILFSSCTMQLQYHAKHFSNFFTFIKHGQNFSMQEK